MKTFMKYACPLMMLGFPGLIFAADTLRQLNAKAKSITSSQMIQPGIRVGAGCGSEVDGISAVGGIYSQENKLYRCVMIFDDKYQPVGTAWVTVDQVQYSASSLQGKLEFQGVTHPSSGTSAPGPFSSENEEEADEL